MRALVQRPSGLIKMGEEVRAHLGFFRGGIHFVCKCCIGANIHGQTSANRTKPGPSFQH
jgi:hypothetical protein